MRYSLQKCDWIPTILALGCVGVFQGSGVKLMWGEENAEWREV